MKAYGKLNLTLDVLGKRPDGYHDISSVMQTISLYDEITIEKSGSWQLVSHRVELPLGDDNLAIKAAKAFLSAAGIEEPGLKISIEKHIPVFAGLGGGSADAAAALREMNAMYGNPLTNERLLKTALSVGSDVPFLVSGGTALVSGRGEVIERLNPLGDCWFVVCKPDFDLSAGQMYGLIDSWSISKRPDTAGFIEALKKGETKTALSMLENVFQPLATSPRPELSEIDEALKDSGAYAVSMTGKGPSMFGVFFSEAEAIASKDALIKQYPNTYLAKNV